MDIDRISSFSERKTSHERLGSSNEAWITRTSGPRGARTKCTQRNVLPRDEYNLLLFFLFLPDPSQSNIRVGRDNRFGHRFRICRPSRNVSRGTGPLSLSLSLFSTRVPPAGRVILNTLLRASPRFNSFRRREDYRPSDFPSPLFVFLPYSSLIIHGQVGEKLPYPGGDITWGVAHPQRDINSGLFENRAPLRGSIRLIIDRGYLNVWGGGRRCFKRNVLSLKSSFS